MHTLHYKKLLLIILLPAFFLPGAAGGNTPPAGKSSLEEQIIGTWKEIDGVETIHFQQKNKVTMEFGPNAPFSLSGEYKIINSEKIEIAFDGLIGFFVDKFILNVSISKNFLEMQVIDAENTNKDIELKIRNKKGPTKYKRISVQPENI